MKIAIHQPRASYYLGGAEVTCIEIAKALSKKHEVTFVTSKNEFTNNFSDFSNGFKEINFKFFDSPKCSEFKEEGSVNIWDFEGIVFGENTREFYKNNKFDLIACFYSGDLLTLNKNGMKTILHLQGYPREYKMIDEISYPKADAHICCSEHVIREMKKLFDIDKFHLYYSCPDLSKFKFTNQKKDIDVLYVGRLTPRKGADLLIHAINKIKDEVSRCVIAGHGELEQQIKNLIIEYGLGEKVEFVGKIQRDEVVELLSRSKTFVLPARSREPFPKALLEAMAIGTPVISAPVGGIPEMIKDNFNGILFEAGSATALSEKIKLLLKDTELSERLKINGANFVKRNFNNEIKEAELLDLYERIYEEK